MSFRENVDDQTDWEPTSSENYFDGSDAYNEQSLAEELRVPVDVVGTARDLERYGINDEEEEEEGDGDEDEERETRATDAMVSLWGMGMETGDWGLGTEETPQSLNVVWAPQAGPQAGTQADLPD